MSVRSNLADVNTRIEAAALRSERKATDISLIAVSKKQPSDKISEVLDAGHHIFGENRVQEAQKHWLTRSDGTGNVEGSITPELHLIGSLQTNKVDDALSLFNVIHTLDRPKLVSKISTSLESLKQAADKSGRTKKPPYFFIQVNTGLEPQKSGIAPNELSDFLELCMEEYALDVRGLMCIPPYEEEPRPHFELLAQLGREHGLPYLSMGMSSDFEVAIECGATHVRVGTDIFGSREI